MSSLIVLALLVGGLWRAEIEYHGWGGLVWLSYFHWAMPVGIGLILIWVNLLIFEVWWRRILLSVLGFIYAIIVAGILAAVLTPILATGPAAMFVSRPETPWEKIVSYGIVGLEMAVIPVGATTVIAFFGYEPLPKRLIYSSLGMLLSIPASMFVLHIVRHVGGDDFIHCIKSGVLWVFWTFSLGIAILDQVRPLGLTWDISKPDVETPIDFQ